MTLSIVLRYTGAEGLWKAALLFILIFALSASPCLNRAVSATIAETLKTPSEDMGIIKLNVHELLMPDTPEEAEYLVDYARILMGSLRDDGSWNDIDYSNKNQAEWPAIGHLIRTRMMAIAYHIGGYGLYNNKELIKKVISAYSYWTTKNLQNPNWWFNRVEVPRILGEILVLIEEDLSEDQFKAGTSILNRSELGAMNGQQMIYMAQNVAVRGCLEGNTEDVRNAYDAVARVLKVSTKEGIQADFSFHENGHVLYSCGYGYNFSLDVSRLAWIARGTGFALSKDTIEGLSRFLLDGQQWMIRGETPDYGSLGREITRKGANIRGLMTVCERMAELDSSRKDEYLAFAGRIRHPQSAEHAILGNRHFWMSDIMTHHRQGYYTSARMLSKRLDNTDWPYNDEGIKNHFLADGANLIMRTGKEYYDIFPVWDWRKVPGVTNENTGEPLLAKDVRAPGITTFVGGVSDGRFGVAAMDFLRDGLSARKSWFFFDNEYVCLGAGITCDSEAPVITTVNQCLLNKKVITSLSEATGKSSADGNLLSNVTWIHHDDIGYVFPGGADVYLSTGKQTGDWKSINFRYTDQPVSQNVFCLWFDHGKGPALEKYAYAIVPGAGVGRMKAYAKAPPFTIISNSLDIQAVSQNNLGLLGIAFFKEGNVRMASGLTVAVNKPCLLLLQERNSGITLSASNPENMPLELVIEINRELSGDNCEWSIDEKISRVTVNLPDGPKAGSAVITFLKKK